MYNPLQERFNDRMNREGKTIYNYWDNSEYKCFFRRNKDTNQTNNNVTIFYPTSEEIKVGMLLKFKDKVFMTLNQETIENEVYYRSDLLETNIVMEVFKNNNMIAIPAYAYELTNADTSNSGQIILINGNIEIMTEHNTISESITINDVFDEMGGTYKITNQYYNSGIMKFHVERQLDNPNDYYEVVIQNTVNQYNVGDTFKLNAITRYIKDSTATIINDQTISYQSSDNSIASVDENGNVLCLQSGNAIFTAYWVEKRKSATMSILIAQEPTEPILIVKAVDKFNKYMIPNQEKTFEVHLWGNHGEIAPPVYEIFDDSYIAPYFKEVSRDGNFITVICNNRSVGAKEDLYFTNSQYGLETILSIEFVSAYPPQYEFQITNTIAGFKIDDTEQITYTAIAYGNTVTNPDVTYSSSDDSIATISNTGLISCISEGNATISATWTYEDNVISDTYSIMITNESYPVEPMITIRNLNEYHEIGDSITLDIVASENGLIVPDETLVTSAIVFDVATYDSATKTIEFISTGTIRVGVYWRSTWFYFYCTVKDITGSPQLKLNSVSTTRTIKLNGSATVYVFAYDKDGNLILPNTFTASITENSSYASTTNLGAVNVNIKATTATAAVGKYVTLSCTSTTNGATGTIRYQIISA